MLVCGVKQEQACKRCLHSILTLCHVARLPYGRGRGEGGKDRIRERSAQIAVYEAEMQRSIVSQGRLSYALFRLTGHTSKERKCGSTALNKGSSERIESMRVENDNAQIR